jgi:hemoglobin
MSSSQSLYERLGGAEGVASISSAIVDRHLANDVIKTRFINNDPALLKELTNAFFAMGSGGPNNYQGRDMRTAHTGMNLNERELVAAIDDVLGVLDDHRIDAVTRTEVLGILYSFKDEVLFH